MQRNENAFCQGPGSMPLTPAPGKAGAQSEERGEPVSVRVHCPHCITPCQVAVKHLGVPVQCYKCSQTFTVRPQAPAELAKTHPPTAVRPGPPRLDIGYATSPGKV